jgi:DNA mismatch endonuclease (patch repair protein)
MALRRALHQLGYRYRLHSRNLPGRPDVVFPSRKKVIFVHGCFWHGHGCNWGKLPKSKVAYWQSKIETNRERDMKALTALRAAGWDTMIVWQCELRDFQTTVDRVVGFLN